MTKNYSTVLRIITDRKAALELADCERDLTPEEAKELRGINAALAAAVPELLRHCDTLNKQVDAAISIAAKGGGK